jgi:hypothetical protein
MSDGEKAEMGNVGGVRGPAVGEREATECCSARGETSRVSNVKTERPATV